MSSFMGHGSSKQVPVTIAAWGSSLKISIQDTGKYAGIITNTALVRLLKEFSVTLTATLIPPMTERKTFSRSTNLGINLPQKCTIRIVVNGLMVNCEAIGEIIGDSGLCFQHPSATEYEPRVAYHNPHYLLRPGSEMPQLEELSLGDSSEAVEKSSLDESNKGLIMKLFDEASNFCMEASMEPSPRLRSTLKE